MPATTSDAAPAGPTHAGPAPAHGVAAGPPLSRIGRVVSALAADPVGFLSRGATALREWPELHRPLHLYDVDPDWERKLHAHFGLSTPCATAHDLQPMWAEVLALLAKRGLAAGPESYLGWNDGDPGFVRAAWCLVHHLDARKVVETGVGQGITSRFILKALARNAGRLWSVDFPPPLHPEVHHQIGAAVDAADRGRWIYVEGQSRQRLPWLLRQVGPIDLFVHDSRHSADNVLFELRQAWAALRPGGAALVDDVDTNNGFHQFLAQTPHQAAWVCKAEPLRPDLRRVNQKGMFGIVFKKG
jgi:hypothetical protein